MRLLIYSLLLAWWSVSLPIALYQYYLGDPSAWFNWLWFPIISVMGTIFMLRLIMTVYFARKEDEKVIRYE